MTSEESIPVESAADMPEKERTVATVATVVCGCEQARLGNGNGKNEALLVVVPGTISCPHCKFEYEVKVKGIGGPEPSGDH